jgi:hypothetical protein
MRTWQPVPTGGCSACKVDAPGSGAFRRTAIAGSRGSNQRPYTVMQDRFNKVDETSRTERPHHTDGQNLLGNRFPDGPAGCKKFTDYCIAVDALGHR